VDEVDDTDWVSVAKTLDTGEGVQLAFEDSPWEEEAVTPELGPNLRAMYKYTVACQIDSGETPKSFHEVTMEMIGEYVDRRTCSKCGQINATSSFQLAKPCEKCGTKLDPNQLTGYSSPVATP
jgi:hypothetical protein